VYAGGMIGKAMRFYLSNQPKAREANMQAKLQLIRQLLARAEEAQEQEEGQGVYIGGGVLFIILLIVLLVLIL
jgi:hypothetical protein